MEAYIAYTDHYYRNGVYPPNRLALRSIVPLLGARGTACCGIYANITQQTLAERIDKHGKTRICKKCLAKHARLQTTSVTNG
jgi:hypothetical protein